MDHYSDKVLLEMFREEGKSSYAFNLLVRKYQERLYWHIRRMLNNHDDADDVMQEVFIKVFKKLHTFRGDADLYTWLYRIATNETLTFIKKQKRRQMLRFEDVSHQVAGVKAARESDEGDRIAELLKQAVSKLPPKQRMIFNMKYFEEMKYDEISQILGTSVGALKASYHHAVKKIEKFVTSN